MYDVAILGGGISGLYLAYNLLKRNSKESVVVVEKGRELGGRVETYQDKWMSVEAGAGRIHNGHSLTLNLIRELGLGSKLVEINNNIRFVREEDGSFETPPHIDIMSRVAAASKKMSKESLIGKSLLEVSMEVVGEDAAKAALASFGYTTEFLKMNAYDAIALMGIIAKPQKYFVLGGGLSQVIERLKARLLSMGCQFETGREVVRINKGEGELYTIFCDNGGPIQSSRCVCTFPVEDVLRLRVSGLGEFTEWKRIIKASVYGGSLCRIYSVFPQSGSESKGSWFAGLGKMTMKNDVRMIIPVDEEKGVVMISYTDGAIANRWARMESEKGIREVNRRLKELIDARLNTSIPMPKHTRVFYWPNGVGYWKVGADSAAVEKRATNGFHGLYFCGENYSAKNQQWVEGALDTAKMVCRKI
jgi:protoporphyrinogen oxidase